MYFQCHKVSVITVSDEKNVDAENNGEGDDDGTDWYYTNENTEGENITL